MPLTHIPTQNFKTTTWSGGTTTELFIYPATANYQQRDFDFRISTAKVEVEQSDFTALPGYSRKLMVLEGAVTLSHQGHHSKKLYKFEVDEFEGDWKTTSKGRCVDFNLMTKTGINGSISGQALNEGNTLEKELDNKDQWFFLYLFTGKLELSFNANTVVVHKGDCVMIENESDVRLVVSAQSNCELVFAEVEFS